MKAIFHSACRSVRRVCIFSTVPFGRRLFVRAVFFVLGPYIMRSELQGGCWVLCLRCRFRHIKKTF